MPSTTTLLWATLLFPHSSSLPQVLLHFASFCLKQELALLLGFFRAENEAVKSRAQGTHTAGIKLKSLSRTYGCYFQCKLEECLASEVPMNIFCLAYVYPSLGKFGPNDKQTF